MIEEMIKEIMKKAKAETEEREEGEKEEIRKRIHEEIEKDIIYLMYIEGELVTKEEKEEYRKEEAVAIKTLEDAPVESEREEEVTAFSDDVDDVGTENKEEYEPIIEESIIKELLKKEMEEFDGFEEEIEEEEEEEIIEEEEEENEEEEEENEEEEEEETIEEEEITEEEGEKRIPKIMDIKAGEIYREEKEKNIRDNVFQASKFIISSADGRVRDEMSAYIYPLEIKKEELNVGIAVIVTSEDEVYIGSSYDNEEGSKIVIMQIRGHEIMFQGSMKNYEFQAKILTSGYSSREHEIINEISKKNQNPPISRIGNGHIKFSYEAEKNLQGKVEVFPIPGDFICIHSIERFVDYKDLKKEDVIIRADGEFKMLVCKMEGEEIKAELQPYEYK